MFKFMKLLSKHFKRQDIIKIRIYFITALLCIVFGA